MSRPVRPGSLTDALSTITYQPFIDGLRAVSILAVVAYHVGIPGASGGYVGVDVFFVISGFLIISQITGSLQRGNFTFGEFWARRALRILPTYLLVVAACVAASPFFLAMPSEFEAFAREVRDAGLMIINHLFREQQGYFDQAADTKPLLHLWSLAVEEQFYLAAPLLLAGLWFLPVWLRRPQLHTRLLATTAIAVFAISLVGCILLTNVDGRNYAFYLTALRAWEFVAGGAAAVLLPAITRLPRTLIGWLGVAGLAAILGCVVLYGSDTPYPSWRATIPVLGALAVLLAGLANPKAPAIRLLATTPMVFVGLVSYAWYLWHWPLLSFMRIQRFGERDLLSDLASAVVSFGLAVATFYLVERSIARWRRRRARLGWRPVLIGAALCGAMAFAGFQVEGALLRRAGAQIAGYIPEGTFAAGNYCDLMKETGPACAGHAPGRPVGLLMGDSQMMFARNPFSRHIAAAGGAAASLAELGCGPFIGVDLLIGGIAMTPACLEGKANARLQLESGSIKADYAILFAQWQWYAEVPEAGGAEALASALILTVSALRSYGVSRILLVGPTPIFPHSVPACLYRADRLGLDRAEMCGEGRSDFDRGTAAVRGAIASAVANVPGVRSVDPGQLFCGETRCLPYVDDQVLIIDNVHLGDVAIDRIVTAHKADFDWVFARAP
jgi:peptidoglycan/LPS O-acetylase OafA/YrhL